MVEQRRGHGPNQTIKQEHMHFYYFNSPANLEYSNNLSLSSFCLRLRVFVSFAVKFKFRSRESYDAYASSRTSETGSSCNSNFLILALAFQCSHVYSTTLAIMPECIYKVLGRIVKVACASCHGGAYEL